MLACKVFLEMLVSTQCQGGGESPSLHVGSIVVAEAACYHLGQYLFFLPIRAPVYNDDNLYYRSMVNCVRAQQDTETTTMSELNDAPLKTTLF